jgi:hypothetical protein
MSQWMMPYGQNGQNGQNGHDEEHVVQHGQYDHYGQLSQADRKTHVEFVEKDKTFYDTEGRVTSTEREKRTVFDTASQSGSANMSKNISGHLHSQTSYLQVPYSGQPHSQMQQLPIYPQQQTQQTQQIQQIPQMPQMQPHRHRRNPSWQSPTGIMMGINAQRVPDQNWQ